MSCSCPRKTPSVHAGASRYFPPPPLELVRNEEHREIPMARPINPEVSAVRRALRRAIISTLGLTQKLSKEFFRRHLLFYKRPRPAREASRTSFVFFSRHYARGTIYGTN